VNGVATLGLSEAVRPMLGGGNRDLLDNAGSLGIGPAFAMQKTAQPSQQPVQQYQPQTFQPAPVQFTAFQPAQPFAPRAQANVPGSQLDSATSQPRTIK
jgi:hypothetical protein